MTDAEQQPGRPVRRRRGLVVALVAGLAVVAAVGLVVFQPWKLVVDETVDEALPTAAAGPTSRATPTGSATARSSATATSSASGTSSPSATPALPTTVALARGTFVSHEHATSGSAVVLRLADGSRVLRLEGLDTSNGPDLHVWLSDQKVVDGPSGWTVFDDGAYVDLGPLKGNRGNQNYVLPADVDLRTLSSVSVWCARFKVSFGAAALTPA